MSTVPYLYEPRNLYIINVYLLTIVTAATGGILCPPPPPAVPPEKIPFVSICLVLGKLLKNSEFCLFAWRPRTYLFHHIRTKFVTGGLILTEPVTLKCFAGYGVAKLVEALCYKSEGCGFDSLLGHGMF
jgi:hypothetical protein